MVIRLIDRQEKESTRPGKYDYNLILDTNDPRSHYGMGVLRIPKSLRKRLKIDILDGITFTKNLNGYFGWTIETDDPDKVCQALGIPTGHPGIIKI
ncbi:MAG: hypothetical protein WC389_11760 [Lutibacter sp.]|jgi:hypothetical protein